MGWAVIGTGTMSAGIAAAIEAVDGAALVGIVSRDPAKAKLLAEKHGHPRVHRDLARALEDPRVQAVYVGSPNAHHFEINKAILAAGK